MAWVHSFLGILCIFIYFENSFLEKENLTHFIQFCKEKDFDSNDDVPIAFA